MIFALEIPHIGRAVPSELWSAQQEIRSTLLNENHPMQAPDHQNKPADRLSVVTCVLEAEEQDVELALPSSTPTGSGEEMANDYSEKKFPLLLASSRLREFVGHSLQIRLNDLLKVMPFAANEDMEEIRTLHRLRIASRKMTTALKLYREVLPPRQVYKMQEIMKSLRRVTNPARDLDVYIQKLSYDRCPKVRKSLDEARKRRQKAQRRITAMVHRQLESGRINRCGRKLIAGICKRGGGETTIGPWAMERLRRDFERFIGTVQLDHNKVSKLHRIRIRVKELRYEVELLAGVFSPDRVDRVSHLLETFQDRLGQLNDQAVSLRRLLKRLNSDMDFSAVDSLWPLLMSEHDGLKKAEQKLKRWWTEARKEELRMVFQQLIDVSVCGTPLVCTGA